jgi:hypothetical protein
VSEGSGHLQCHSGARVAVGGSARILGRVGRVVKGEKIIPGRSVDQYKYGTE